MLLTLVLRAGGLFEPSWWWSQDDRLLTYAWSRSHGDLETVTQVMWRRTTRFAKIRDNKLMTDECERRRRHLGLPDRDELVERHAQVGATACTTAVVIACALMMVWPQAAKAGAVVQRQLVAAAVKGWVDPGNHESDAAHSARSKSAGLRRQVDLWAASYDMLDDHE